MAILCYKCGTIGHKQFQCEAIQEVVSEGDEKTIHLFGHWIQSDCHIRDCFKAAKLGDGKHLRKNGVFEKYKARKSMVRPKVTQSLLGEASDQLEKGLSKTYSP